MKEEAQDVRVVDNCLTDTGADFMFKVDFFYLSYDTLEKTGQDCINLSSSSTYKVALNKTCCVRRNRQEMSQQW